jgi:hypothetical protein
VDIVDNSCKEIDLFEDTDLDEIEDETEIRVIKSNQSIAESNLMVIPFVSMKKTKVKILKRVWMSNGVERGITVKGSVDLGVPTIDDLDLLLALFRVHMKNNDYKYQYNKSTKKVFIPQKINFTFRELALEMGYSEYGGTVKKKLENSLKKLVETTIYSELGGALRDVEKGEYITEIEGIESFRILTDYKSYSYKKKKAKGEKIGTPEEVKENTSVMIDTFFYNQICNNYFKIYDYSEYIRLTKGASKKLYLLLNQWSHGYEKFLSYQVLYDYLGLDDNKSNSYNNREIKKGLDELIEIGFIDGFNVERGDGINIIFNEKLLGKGYFLDRYKSDNDMVARLREHGINYTEITKYVRLDNTDYVKALLRYIDKKLEKNTVKDVHRLTLDGLKTESYNLEGYYG